ncbi:MAG: hypothetical protein C4584_01580 [Armatimonadetes bacterium]|nr:MAG: hypothetical protein C4584_01580 [Armatimonadota bacterium]
MIFLIFVTFFFISTTTLASADTITLNEFYSAGSTSASTGPDWVEIYNDGSDISLYQLLDDGDHSKNLSNASCNDNFCTIDWSNLLNNTGDTIKLVLISSGEILDQVTYSTSGDIPAPSTGQSAGRDPDGTGSWVIFSTPSKGSSNNSSSTPTFTPSPIPTNTPTPTALPSPTPTRKPTSIPVIFNIASTPSSINTDQFLSVSIEIKGWTANQTYYLKGAFIKDGSTNYFGQTKVGPDWIKNNQKYDQQFLITTNSSGEWNGSLDVMPDKEDSGFTGDDEYIFKVGSYTQSGNGPEWSNTTTINIKNNSTPTPIAINTTSTSFVQPTSNLSLQSSPNSSPTHNLQIPAYLKAIESSVAGTASTSGAIFKETVAPPAQTASLFSLPIFGGFVLILTGIGTILFHTRTKILGLIKQIKQ